MALTDKLTAIGVAIREKTGKSDLLTLDQMPTEIASISGGGGGGGLPEEAFIISGRCEYKFAYDSWTWFLNSYKNQITTNNITNCANMFRMIQQLDGYEIPFTINVNNCKDFSYMFYNSYLVKCPKIRGTIDWDVYGTTFDQMIDSVSWMQSFDDLFTSEMIDEISSKMVITSAYAAPKMLRFNSCSAMRHVPEWFYHFKLQESSQYFPYYHIYDDLFNYCNALDEVRGLQVWNCQGEKTDNMLGRTFRNCGRVKAITFETNEDGSPKVAKWKNQVLDLTTNVGFVVSTGNIGSHSGIHSQNDWVKDDATYAALKDSPNWFTDSQYYSRYNHDSAVETINSLPDTSAVGGNNIIRFRGYSGLNTDGGAISTLTDEEKAVATAKGWTVEIV